jgi:hypothetical protein
VLSASEGAPVGERRDADGGVQVLSQRRAACEADVAGDVVDRQVGRLQDVPETSANDDTMF